MQGTQDQSQFSMQINASKKDQLEFSMLRNDFTIIMLRKPINNAHHTSTGINRNKPLKSTSPFPSVSNISMTRCTSGFCCNSGRDINSSTLREPELSRSSFLNRFPSLLISSASTEIEREMEKTVKTSYFNKKNKHPFILDFLQLQPYIHLEKQLQRLHRS